MKQDSTQIQEPEKWEYFETPHAAVIVIGDVQLKPHWSGVTDSDALRGLCRRGVRAVSNYDALVKATANAIMLLEEDVDNALDVVISLRAALAAAKE